MSLPAEGEAASCDHLIGEVLANRYRIEQRLGEGAMGTVFKAIHVKVGRPFAVKVLHRRLLLDSKVAQRFEREAELAGRLRHPNVIGVVDVGETNDGLRYMVMDFAEGQDLATLLSDAPFRPDRVLHLTREMLEGLYHAHEQGLIHRDFKPENVIVERDDHDVEVPRIVDFGIAILRDAGESTSSSGRLTTNGLVLGTPHYMAPEQAIADPIDHRIDLFALGIVIYEMLCGKLPFEGTGAEVARANLLLDPPPIAQRVPYLEVDPLLEAFARRLMAKKRDQRPATAKAARELLDLIERDRSAAAAVLGVPLSSSGRAPAITQDVAPPREPQPSTELLGSEMPPRIEELEAPPLADTPARISATHARRGPRTDVADPLPFDAAPPRRSRRWLIPAVAVVAAGAIVAVVLMREPTNSPPPPQKQAVLETPPIDAAVAPPPVKDPDPTPVKVDPPVVDTGSGSGSAVQTVAVVDPPKPPSTATPTRTPRHPPSSGSAKVATVPPVPTAGSAEQAPPPPKPVPEVTTSMITTLYADVGNGIRALRAKGATAAAEAASEKYRLLRYSDMIATPESRLAAAASLRALQAQIAANK